MKIATKMDVMSLALLLGSISGVLSVETAMANTTVDDSRKIDQIIQESCGNKNAVGEHRVIIKLLAANVISVTCKDAAVAEVVVSALPGGSVELNLTKPC